VTNGERADRLVREARQIAREMAGALAEEAWNLATRRAQEALELTLKALLNEMTVDYPKIHDPAPVLARAIQVRDLRADPDEIDSLTALSRELSEVRAPAFYQEIAITEAQARDWVQRVERVLQFGEDLLARLRRTR